MCRTILQNEDYRSRQNTHFFFSFFFQSYNISQTYALPRASLYTRRRVILVSRRSFIIKTIAQTMSNVYLYITHHAIMHARS